MQQIKQDILEPLKVNIEKLLRDNERVVYTYEVVPLDYKIRDYESPLLWATNQRLFFTYDELVEIYEYSEIEMDILGEAPRFNPIQNILEQRYYYSPTTRDSYNQLKNTTFYSRFAFNEAKQIPKEFALRSDTQVALSYQSWAMAQSIINLKNGLPEDKSLAELFKGSFARYSQGMVLVFFIIFIVYVLAKGLLGSLFDFLNVGLDIAFGIISVYMFWWIYRTTAKNLNRFKAIYNRYRVDENSYIQNGLRDASQDDARSVTSQNTVSPTQPVNNVQAVNADASVNGTVNRTVNGYVNPVDTLSSMNSNESQTPDMTNTAIRFPVSDKGISINPDTQDQVAQVQYQDQINSNQISNNVLDRQASMDVSEESANTIPQTTMPTEAPLNRIPIKPQITKQTQSRSVNMPKNTL